MYIDDLFTSPVGHIAAFAQMQVHLYREDISLQDYFEALQLDTLRSPRASSREQPVSNWLSTFAIYSADKISRLGPRQKIKTDVLFCPNPDFRRRTEAQFFVRTLRGLAETGAKVVCMLPADAPCRSDLDTQLADIGRDGQVQFVDPTTSLNPLEQRLRSRVARKRARSALDKTIRILEPRGLSPSREVEAGFERLAYFVEAWERLAPWVEFDAVVARCHWHALCSPVCRTALGRGKPVITFQQGVIGHTLDVPVTASKYVAFGQPSASFLARLNRRFFQAVGRPEPGVEYSSGGCLFDTVMNLPDQFEQKTLLMVDAQAGPDDFYGVESQCRAILQLAERLLTSDLPLRQLVIRPHPYWNNLDLQACQRLIREHPSRCELSHPVWSLGDDLRRSSAVIGIFSGVLTVSSSCGLPTIFLETEHGYTTGDLACFGPGQTLQPDAAFDEISRILTDRQAYADARTQALRNAREYYAGGANSDLGATFFERLLRAEPLTGPQHELKREPVSSQTARV